MHYGTFFNKTLLVKSPITIFGARHTQSNRRKKKIKKNKDAQQNSPNPLLQHHKRNRISSIHRIGESTLPTLLVSITKFPMITNTTNPLACSCSYAYLRFISLSIKYKNFYQLIFLQHTQLISQRYTRSIIHLTT